MTLKVLIVSDRPDYRQLLAHHVSVEWANALTAEYEPAARGRLPDGFTGSAYDAVLLDHEVQGGHGLEWLEELRDRPHFPPILYMTPVLDAVAVQLALASGAAHVLLRTDFEHAQLIDILRNVLARRRDNGGDNWASADGRLAVGGAFSTLSALVILHELGVPGTHEAVKGGLERILQAWREDGRFRLAPDTK